MIKYCPACNNENHKNIGKPILHENDNNYNVIECQECKLQWCNPFPTEMEMHKHYTTYYQKRFNRLTKSKLKSLRDLITFKYAREFLFLKKTSKFTKIENFLDYGCGEGEMLLHGKKLGWNCTGTEYSDELSSKYEKLEINVIVAKDFENSGLKKNNFDLIIFKHLIEHIQDIPFFLTKTKEYLTDKGVIAIKTPSNTSLRALTKTANWHIVNPPEHLWSFNPHNFKLLLENNGFEVLTIRNSLIVNELICYARAIQ